MKKKHTFRKEVIFFMLLASACTLLSAGIAIFYVFFSFFSQKAGEDIIYVLNNTNKQYQAHIQFVEDTAISIRHNILLNEFFEDKEYDVKAIESQLAYSVSLFSERNMVKRQVPFVTSMYLFNNNDKCIYEHYYASTLIKSMEQESRYRDLYRKFKQQDKQYICLVDSENMNIIFRIYDDNMKQKGIAIAQISLAAIETILSDVSGYSNSSWLIMSGDNILASGGDKKNNDILKSSELSWTGNKELSDIKILGCSDTSGFGMRTVIVVGRENIFSILKPTLQIFLLGLFIVISLTIFVSYIISYRFTKPVTKMIDSIRAFGRQDFDARIESSSIQEFHDIQEVFNEMADRIKYLITEVYEKQLLATKAQVKYLQSQINPHFQFNILAMFCLKAKLAGNEELYEGLNAFSKLIQGKIFREKEIKIRVREELEIVNFYLFLQKERYQDKLFYEISLENEEINDYLIPRLLIEPLVENAVSHGLEPKKESGLIKVHLYEKKQTDFKENSNRMLYICIEDNGVGIDNKKIDRQKNSDIGDSTAHTHTGLWNTKKMLKILYGDTHEFKIFSKKGEGTRIEIVLPVERNIEYVESDSGR